MANKKRLVVDMPQKTYDALKAEAEAQERAVSGMINRIVALSLGVAKPEVYLPVGTQVEMPVTKEQREAAIERVR